MGRSVLERPLFPPLGTQLCGGNLFIPNELIIESAHGSDAGEAVIFNSLI